MLPLEFMQRLAARAIEERPLTARAQAAIAPDPLPRRAGTERQAARDGGATTARGARPGSAARLVQPGLSPEWRLFVMTSFLGRLTTFSTFSAEVLALL